MVAAAVDRWRQAPLFMVGFVAAMAVATWLRLAPVLADFPLGDGGLFWIMAGELRDNGFVPPMTTSFNLAGIPWMYPPLGLYLVALPGGGLEWFRVIPALFAVATLPAMWLLARALTSDRAALVATIAYGLTLAAYFGLITGGGATRSPGVFLALLTMWAVVTGRVGSAGVLGGLVILTHPMAAFYGAAGSAVLWATRGAPLRMALAPVISLLIGAAWFVPMVLRHGIDPLLASVGSREIALTENAVILAAAALNPPNLAFTIGALGVVVAVLRRRWDLLAWLGVTALGGAVVDRWAVIPLAVLAGFAVDAAISSWPRMPTVAFLAVALVTAITGVALIAPPGPVTADERAVMSWAAAETPSDATFAVIGYQADGGMVEWFPALSGRRNLTTWQGTEWIPGGHRRHEAAEAADCRELGCLPDADYYVLRPDCCATLASQLSLVGPGVYERTDR